MADRALAPSFQMSRAQFICLWVSNKGLSGQGGRQQWNHIYMHYICIKTESDAIFYLGILINGRCCTLWGLLGLVFCVGVP